MTSIGERLRRQRLQNKVSLETVSLETKIGVRLLEAIEAGQFEKLPGGVFRRSFVLQYAQALALDSEEIASELNQLNQFDEIPPLPNVDHLMGREPKSDSGFAFRGDFNGMGGSTLGSLIVAVGVIMACALVYSWWQTPRVGKAEKVQIASVQPTARAAERPEAAAPTASSVQAAAPAPQPTPTAPAADTTPARADPAHVRVGLSADEETWISISSDGKNVFAQALGPHETKIVEASEKVRLLVGNAGGVEVSLNGKPIGPIGPRGQVRVVELTPAGFQIVQRKPPSPEQPPSPQPRSPEPPPSPEPPSPEPL